MIFNDCQHPQKRDNQISGHQSLEIHYLPSHCCVKSSSSRFDKQLPRPPAGKKSDFSSPSRFLSLFPKLVCSWVNRRFFFFFNTEPWEYDLRVLSWVTDFYKLPWVFQVFRQVWEPLLCVTDCPQNLTCYPSWSRLKAGKALGFLENPSEG